jgi:hypothetical protein
MAHYVVTPDDYAGWNPTGRYFACASGAIGLVGLLCWLSLHGRLGFAPPSNAADQTILTLLAWIGSGGFLLMLFAALASISLSRKSRGTLTVTDVGVTRIVGNDTHSLAWTEIEGFVTMPYGGVTLVSTVDKPSIIVPRFLDDYRACIAEFKDHDIQPIPASRLRAGRKKTTWMQVLTTFFFVFLYLSAVRPGHSHALRITFLCASITMLLGTFYRDRVRQKQPASLWGPILILTASLVWAAVSMAHAW